MKRFKVSAPGKLHLMGEHAVVYGKPAILAGVDKRCFIDISERKDSQIKILSKDLNKNLVKYCQCIIEQFAKYHNIRKMPGFTLSITSEIPIGSGMGSSGALAVATAGSLSL